MEGFIYFDSSGRSLVARLLDARNVMAQRYGLVPRVAWVSDADFAAEAVAASLLTDMEILRKGFVRPGYVFVGG